MESSTSHAPVYKSFRLGHLGLAAEMARECGLVETIDEILGVDEQEILTEGQSTLAMAINALGYTSRPLYISPQFFESTHVPFLLGKPNKASIEEILPDHLNEHKLGRTLDQIAQYGPDAFFLKVATTAFIRLGVKVPQLHLDTTIHQFYGEYVDADGTPRVANLGDDTDNFLEPSQVIITRGFCKDGRADLKQVVQEVLVSSDGDVPLMFKLHSGNASDVVIMRERMNKLKEELIKVDAASLFPKITVADCKFYSEQSLKAAERDASLWVTRVPNGITEAKKSIADANQARSQWRDPTKLDWRTVTTKGLKFQEFTIEKYGIQQSYIVVKTDASESRAKKSVEAAVKREAQTIEAALKKIAKKSFSCESDLQSACISIFDSAKYHESIATKFESETQHQGRGRPRRNESGSKIFRLIDWSFSETRGTIATAILEQRCFVLATNAAEDEIATEDVLQIYMKDQHGVESAFRFLKDPSYFADAFFLKNPSRIAALICVMTISLLLYSLLQRKLRMELESQKETLPNQKKKETKRPTLRWVNQCFEGIDVVKVTADNKTSYHFQRMKPFVTKTLALLGENYLRRYSEVCM